MVDAVLVLLFCLLMGLAALIVCVWVVLSGQLATLDGLLLIFISLLLGGLFMLNLAWSVRTGEVREVLNHYRKGSAQMDTSSQAPQS